MIRVLFIFIIIMCSVRSKAQDNTGCLTKYQLLRMQSSSLEEVRIFLNNQEWSFDEEK